MFRLSGAQNKFVPKGPARYGGWLLYFGMPHIALGDVRLQVRKLSADLGKLKYPTLGPATNDDKTPPFPYPSSDSETETDFTRSIQCCLHRFQEEASDGKARKPGTGLPASWEALRGTDVAIAKLEAHERGFVDEPTAASLEQWLNEGVVRPGIPLVQDRGLWGDHRLWWRHWALEEICKVLGALYEPHRGSSLRKLTQTGGGQASQSKHKIGMAFDLSAHQAEPSKATPFGVEADFQPATDGAFRPRWLIFLHSSFNRSLNPADLQTLRNDLTAVVGKVTTRMTQHMGEPLEPEAQQFLTLVQKLIDELVLKANTPGTGGLGTELAQDFFRKAIRRFQWRELGDDGGTVQEDEVTALDDAKANEFANADAAKSWLNFSRLAHRIELFSIQARDDFSRPGFELSKNASKLIKLRPGGTPRPQKATIMDRIADGIENAGPEGLIAYYDPDKRVPKDQLVGQLKVADFDLKTMRDWIRRPSDQPDALSPAPQASEGFDFANTGVDLRITLFTGAGKSGRQKYFAKRETLNAEFVFIGQGLQFPKGAAPELHKVSSLKAIAELLDKATAKQPLPNIKVKKGEPGLLDVIIRPRIYKPTPLGKEPNGSDPGRFSFEVLPSGEPLSLEWWHFELGYGGIDWLTRAESFGLSRDVLAAKLAPIADSQGPVWQGGLGFEKPSSYGSPSDPGALPRQPKVPVS